MEWWHFVLTLASIAFTATTVLAGWALKTLVDIKAQLAGVLVWQTGTDARLRSHDRRFERLGFRSDPTLKPERQT